MWARPKTPLSDVLADVKFEYPTLPAEMLEDVVRRTVFLMCRDGDLSRYRERVKLQANVENYRLAPPAETAIWALHSVHYVGQSMVGSVRTLVGPPEVMEHSAVAWFEAPDVIYIRRVMGFQSPDCCDVTCSLVPSPDACSVDSALIDNNYETLLEGVRWRLSAMEGMPWGAPERAQYHRQNFEQGVRDAKIFELISGRRRGALRLPNKKVL
jgi:hypothetical protein